MTNLRRSLYSIIWMLEVCLVLLSFHVPLLFFSSLICFRKVFFYEKLNLILALTIPNWSTSSGRSLPSGRPIEGCSEWPWLTRVWAPALECKAHLSKIGCLLPVVMLGGEAAACPSGLRLASAQTPHCAPFCHIFPSLGKSSEVCSRPCDPRCHGELPAPPNSWGV